MQYTYDEKYNNYCILVNAISEIDNSYKFSKDWFIKHKALIILYRDWISDYSKVHPEIEDLEYRQNAFNIEFLLTYLCDQIKNYGNFDIGAYRRLNVSIKFVVDYMLSKEDADELSSFMQNLAM
jgi:hypothetical protein